MRGITEPTKRWKDREDLQIRWEKTWSEPHMREGLATLIEMGLPTLTPNFDTNVQAITNALREGYYLAIENISRLNPQLITQRAPQLKPFEHLRKKAESAQQDKK